MSSVDTQYARNTLIIPVNDAAYPKCTIYILSLWIVFFPVNPQNNVTRPSTEHVNWTVNKLFPLMRVINVCMKK